MALRVCVVLLALLGLVACQTHSYEGRFISRNAAMSATWKTSLDEKTIDFEIKGKTKGWIAIGFNNSTRMAGSEVIYGWVDKLGNAYVYSGACSGHLAPTSTTKNQITKIKGSQSGAVTTISFSRPVSAMGVAGSRDLKRTTYVLMATCKQEGKMIGDGSTGRIAKHSDYASGKTQFVKTPIINGTSSVPQPTGTGAPVKGGSFTDANNKYSARWFVQGSDIFITMSGSTDGWVGFGLNTVPSMVGGDMYVAFVDNGENILLDQFATNHARPMDDTSAGGTNNAQLLSLTKENGKITAFFKRPLNTKDSKDQVITNQPINVLWAIGDDIGFNGDRKYQQHTTMGMLQANLMA